MGRCSARTAPRPPAPAGFWATDITPVRLADGTLVTKDDGPRAGVTLEGHQRHAAGVPPARHRDGGELLPRSTTAPPRS